jgi:DNA polymerase-3 subunit gamma/tau
MSYMALYRKFRPREFQDVKGQDHIITALKNQVRTGRIGHAYLFTGTRGTGKTTVAKILARAVNCEHPLEDGSPCNDCPTCQHILDGSSLNVIEIDAASNNGVDNIRDIIEEVAYPPTEGKYKVYIIDEVHMLSQGAFNALLKTLEEPPSYVIFILATTEVQKVPITIISRCQRYDFHRISIDTIAGRMRELMDQEKVDIDDKALRYIAKCADGSMRDGLSILDECIAFYMDRHISYDDVLKILGAVDNEIFQRLLGEILAKKTIGAIETIEGVVNEGRELTQFVNDFVWYLRNLLLAKSMDHAEDLLEMSTENFEALKETAANIDDHILVRYIRILSDLSNEMKFSSQKRILLEVAVIRMCRPEMEEDLDSLIERIDDLEKQVEEGVAIAPSDKIPDPAAGESRPKPREIFKKQMIPDATPEEVKRLAHGWNGMVDRIPDSLLKEYMKQLLPTVSPDGKLELVADPSDPSGSIVSTWIFDDPEKEDHQKKIQEIINDYAGANIELVFEKNESGRDNRDAYEDLVSKFGSEHNIDINVEIDNPEEGGNE